MRFVGVLLGSLIASAVLVGVWAWTGAVTGMQRQACQQTAADGTESAHQTGDIASGANVGPGEEPVSAVEPGPSDLPDPASIAPPGSAAIETLTASATAAEHAAAAMATAQTEAEHGARTATWQPPSRDTVITPPPSAVVGSAVTGAEAQSSVHWHSFWQPFTSEISARGFAARLEQLTGLDFQVRRAGVGEYEVAFAHLDDRQRQAHLERIQTVTGLELERQEQEP